MSLNYKWDEEIHGDELLWVCPYCDAHCNADAVGEKCPACGEVLNDEDILEQA